MLSGDFPAFTQTQFRHAVVSHNISQEEMSMEKRDTFHIFGKAVQTQEGITKKSSNALATTLSTCQVPGTRIHVFNFYIYPLNQEAFFSNNPSFQVAVVFLLLRF